MAKNKEHMQRYLRFSTMGLEMGILVLGGLFAGQYLDERYGTQPYWLLGCLLFGLVAAFRSLWRGLRALQAEMNREQQEQKQQSREQ
ncbi:MAG: AtpZ/AtpI family protein [Deltaproteobacteria bacterium]|nr:AtpZ/AtpI family protein [Deltaproteobacteria bacterium]